MWWAGLATAGFATFPFNPISALCISTAICMRWTMIGHHVCHGGYNAQVGIDNRFHRATFARGPVRRFMDWCDWMLPEVGLRGRGFGVQGLGFGCFPRLVCVSEAVCLVCARCC